MTTELSLSECIAHYNINQQDVIDHALEILETRLVEPISAPITQPGEALDFLRLKLAEKEHEVFAVLFLDVRHRVIAYEEMFRGTIDSASIHPREVAKACLSHNAAAVILAHNHPSGDCTPSCADQTITEKLKNILVGLEIRVLDHVVIGGIASVSFAERGLL